MIRFSSYCISGLAAYWVYLLLLMGISLSGTTAFAEAGEESIGEYLTANGKLIKGARGSFDPAGYRLVLDANGSPVFLPDEVAPASFTKSIVGNTNNEYWHDGFGIPGASAPIRAAASDGAGNLYVGGEFGFVGNVIANGIARWDGTTWHTMGTGVDTRFGDRILTLLVDGSNVYAGGEFSSINGVSCNNIAKWDGTQWSALASGVNGYVYDLETVNGLIYAGGAFDNAGAVSCSRIACWDGSSWSSLGSGMLNSVTSLATDGTKLFAGGEFISTKDQTVMLYRIGQWDGMNWSTVGGGVNGPVSDIAWSETGLFACGQFTTAGGNPANGLARWDGTSWSALSISLTGGSSQLMSMEVVNGDLYIGGNFEHINGIAANNIARYESNTDTWSAMDTGTNTGSLNGAYTAAADVFHITEFQGQPVAAGHFRQAGSTSALYVSRWNGSGWDAFGTGLDNQISTIAVNGKDVYIGGLFKKIGNLTVNHVARWDGTNWHTLGTGTDEMVYGLAVHGSEVYAAGRFQTAGGVPSPGVAKWNGLNWQSLGSGLDGTASAFAFNGSDIYVGGWFTQAGGTAANNIAKWDGIAWTALGSGTNAGVNGLEFVGSDLYVGGYFSIAGGASNKGIARWNGTNWNSVGGGLGGTNPIASSIACVGSDLYVGGYFTTAGGVPANRVARWNGTSWSALGTGADNAVQSLAVSDGKLIVGGWFDTAGGLATPGIALWNGSNWETIGTGTFGWVYDVAVTGNSLFVGGSFQKAGDKVSNYLALWQPAVDVSTATLSAAPTPQIIGATAFGYYKPSIEIPAGVTVTYTCGLPVTVTLDRADEIQVDNIPLRSAFTLAPEGVTFSGTLPTLTVEFSAHDVAAFPGTTYQNFRAVQVTYPLSYPADKNVETRLMLPDQSAAIPTRMENGTQIYEIKVPISSIESAYVAMPEATATRVLQWDLY